MPKLNILNELIVYHFFSFVSTIDKILIRKSLLLQNLFSKLNSKLWENVSSFHPNDKEKINRAYLQQCSCQPLNHDFPKKEISGVLHWSV